MGYRCRISAQTCFTFSDKLIPNGSAQTRCAPQPGLSPGTDDVSATISVQFQILTYDFRILCPIFKPYARFVNCAQDFGIERKI